MPNDASEAKGMNKTCVFIQTADAYERSEQRGGDQETLSPFSDAEGKTEEESLGTIFSLLSLCCCVDAGIFRTIHEFELHGEH